MEVGTVREDRKQGRRSGILQRSFIGSTVAPEVEGSTGRKGTPPEYGTLTSAQLADVMNSVGSLFIQHPDFVIPSRHL